MEADTSIYEKLKIKIAGRQTDRLKQGMILGAQKDPHAPPYLLTMWQKKCDLNKKQTKWSFSKKYVDMPTCGTDAEQDIAKK